MDEILKEHLANFMDHFELVFGDDWMVTQCCIKDNEGDLIALDGTPLDPKVDDEANNWANRGSLLGSYRNLAETMIIAGIRRNPL